jgi:hypothetical protein
MLKGVEHLMSGAIDLRPDGGRDQPVPFIGPEQRRQDVGVVLPGVQPGVLIRGIEDHRHPVADRLHHGVRAGRQDGVAVDPFPIRRLPSPKRGNSTGQDENERARKEESRYRGH